MPLVTEVARVVISPETIGQTLNKTRKKKLRKEAVKAYIISKPYGKRITATEFTKVANYPKVENVWVLLNAMIRDGEIVKHNIGTRSFHWTVPKDPVVTKVADKPDKDKAMEEALAKLDKIENTAAPEPNWTFSQLETLAMRFEFYTGENGTGKFLRWLLTRQ